MSAPNSPERGWLATDDAIDAGAVLCALDDDACRAILVATSEESLTATELSEQCDTPMSTAYRKVETLTEAELVEERVRINTSGKHATEYRKSFDDVCVSIDDGEVAIEMTKPEAECEARSARESLCDSRSPSEVQRTSEDASETASGETASETDASANYAVADD